MDGSKKNRHDLIEAVELQIEEATLRKSGVLLNGFSLKKRLSKAILQHNLIGVINHRLMSDFHYDQAVLPEYREKISFWKEKKFQIASISELYASEQFDVEKESDEGRSEYKNFSITYWTNERYEPVYFLEFDQDPKLSKTAFVLQDTLKAKDLSRASQQQFDHEAARVFLGIWLILSNSGADEEIIAEFDKDLGSMNLDREDCRNISKEELSAIKLSMQTAYEVQKALHLVSSDSRQLDYIAGKLGIDSYTAELYLRNILSLVRCKNEVGTKSKNELLKFLK
jgi:hypothetical protein